MAPEPSPRSPIAGIQVDNQRCRDCQACTLACSLWHEGECNPALARLSVIKDMERYEFQILVCHHCEPPACLEACPVEAIQRDSRGVARIDDEECIRCGSCAEACPHGALFHHRSKDRYLKCDLCTDREGGPACVELCPVGALSLSQQ